MINISYGELRIKEILEREGVTFKPQLSFQDLRSDANRRLRFDFGIFKHNKLVFIIEYDGIQHIRPVKQFGGEAAYNIQIEHDRRKNKYCSHHSIPLHRILYSDYVFLEKIVLELLSIYNIIEQNEVENER